MSFQGTKRSFLNLLASILGIRTLIHLIDGFKVVHAFTVRGHMEVAKDVVPLGHIHSLNRLPDPSNIDETQRQAGSYGITSSAAKPLVVFGPTAYQ